jgi:hypothetical protein
VLLILSGICLIKLGLSFGLTWENIPKQVNKNKAENRYFIGTILKTKILN